MIRRLARLVGSAALAFSAVIFVPAKLQAQTQLPSTPPAAAQDPAGAAAAAAESTDAKEANPATPTVRIVFKVLPPNNATVTWGSKRLGIIKPKAPLIIERPRDSGPLDVVVKCAGYVTVHTRAYTFTNTTLAVKLTPVDKKNTLYGYREELPPEPDAAAATPGAAPAAVPPPGGAMAAPPASAAPPADLAPKP